MYNISSSVIKTLKCITNVVQNVIYTRIIINVALCIHCASRNPLYLYKPAPQYLVIPVQCKAICLTMELNSGRPSELMFNGISLSTLKQEYISIVKKIYTSSMINKSKGQNQGWNLYSWLCVHTFDQDTNCCKMYDSVLSAHPHSIIRPKTSERLKFSF